ncbi:MAG: dihydropteroate synthase [Planctomycetota bacterium]|jgi:dihydropteroate synthase
MSEVSQPPTSPWGAVAAGLAPRTPGGGLIDLQHDGLVRVSFAADGAPRPEVEALLDEALTVRRSENARVCITIHRTHLEEAARQTRWIELLLGAFDHATKPAPLPRLVGVLNVTPDSFSDGGRFSTVSDALDHGRELREAGAAIIDVGGESTRPGASPVDEAEELKRVLPVVEALVAEGLGPISIDTRRSRVAERALDAGATIVNDIEAGTRDRDMLRVVADRRANYVAMHMLGSPANMQDGPDYEDVVGEVAEFLRGRVEACLAAGIPQERVWLDPGIGFGKRLEHNLELLDGLSELRSLGRPLLVGVSRKRFIGTLTEESVPERRKFGTAAAVAACVSGGAEYLRVHDVAEMRAVVAVSSALALTSNRQEAPC